MAQSGTSYEILSKISCILIELKLASYYEREFNTPENTIMFLFITPTVCISIVFSFSWAHFNSQEKLKTMRIQNLGVTNKEHCGMLWYFLEWSILTDNLVPRLLSSPRNEVAKATTMPAREARTLQVVSFEQADDMSAPENCHVTRKARSR